LVEMLNLETMKTNINRHNRQSRVGKFRAVVVAGLLLLLPFSIQSNLTLLSQTVLASNINQDLLTLYSKLSDSDLPLNAFIKAIQGQKLLAGKNVLKNDSILTIVDFSKPSNKERFFVINTHNGKILYKTLVAHGQNTGDVYAENFSNDLNSHKSSLGFYITNQVYMGSNGYSLILDGIEKGINDMARQRAIVVHGADYVSYNYIAKYGRLGRSFGCPAIPRDIAKAVIDLIKNGSCMYLYYPSESTSPQLAMNW
jgi:hypothetical protein